MHAIYRRKPFRLVTGGFLVLAALLVVPPTSASAAPFVIEYSDHYWVTTSRKISNDFTFPIFNGASKTLLELPRFDPALGELSSVDLWIRGSLRGRFQTHCQSPVSCNADASGGVRTALSLDFASEVLGVDLGDAITLGVNGERDCSFTTIPVASCSRQWTATDNDSRLLTFSGADVAGFVRTETFPTFRFTGSQQDPAISLRHAGFPDAAPGGGGDVDAAGHGASLPGLLDLLDLALQLYLNDVLDNHGVLFSDAHLYADSWFSATVKYTYQSEVASVPEPGVLALVGLGVSAFSVVRGQRRRIS